MTKFRVVTEQRTGTLYTTSSMDTLEHMQLVRDEMAKYFGKSVLEQNIEGFWYSVTLE